MRQCLFCERTADSVEDAWPKWILERLAGKTAITAGYIGARELHWPDPTFKVKCVCKTCNNDWMSKLEGANIPLVGCMMQDVSLSLDPLQQWTIALWAMKTSMVMDSVTHHRGSFYTKTECHQLRSSSVLPPYTHMFLGRYSGQFTLAFFGDDIWDGKPDNPGTTRGYIKTLIVGRMALQIMTYHVPPNDRMPIAVRTKFRPGPWNDLLIDLWPRRGRANWPPNLSVTDEGTTSLVGIRKRWRPPGL